MPPTNEYQATPRTGRAEAPFAMVARSVLRSRDEIVVERDGSRRRLKPMEKLVFAELAAFDWHGEGCWPSRETLAADLDVSEDTIDRAVSGLVKAGLVEKRRRGQGLTNTYLLRPPDSAPVRTPEAAPVRPEVDEGEVDEEIKGTPPAGRATARPAVVEAIKGLVYDLEDADELTELTFVTHFGHLPPEAIDEAADILERESGWLDSDVQYAFGVLRDIALARDSTLPGRAPLALDLTPA
jgi:DNA-binding transcriptional ArsR family regulator